MPTVIEAKIVLFSNANQWSSHLDNARAKVRPKDLGVTIQ